MSNSCGIPRQDARIAPRACCSSGDDLRAELFDVAHTYSIPKDTLHIVRFIRAAQATGFTLEDVRTLLTLWDGQSALCKDVQPLVAKRLEEVTQRLQDIWPCRLCSLGAMPRKPDE